MSLGKLKRRLQSLINRKDVTDTLAEDFITEAIADLERVLRISPMERILTQSVWDGSVNALIIPGTFLESIDLFTDSNELTQVDMAQFLKLDNTGGSPRYFVKIADRFLLRPTPAPDTKVYLHCYVQSDPLAFDTDRNVWTEACFNAVLYTAAAAASDFFQMEDEHVRRYMNKAEMYVSAINDQSLDEKWAGRLSIPLPQDRGSF